MLLVAQHGAVPRATEEFVQRFANSIFARGRAVFPDSQMLRIHSALMLTLSRNVQESVAVLDRLNTRIQWPDVRYQRLQIMRLNNVLSGITSHEKTYWARIIDRCCLCAPPPPPRCPATILRRMWRVRHAS